ncbi:unnamed protein product [Blepharisma stoltei]|uniref:Receptor ligand binding region domain-containing protein n=1 Tax=Blepharisma stoltei TaxID=1481888 RepID=A0AAU9IXV7_9CILI|nr:unnamed protein product [Blepharisma stoltei]
MNKKSAKKKQGISGIGFVKILCLLSMLNLSSSADIIIAQNNKNIASENWIKEIKNQFNLIIDWHHCNHSAISECLNIYPDTLIVLDLSDDFEIQLSLSQLCEENKKIHLVPQRRYESLYHDKWTYNIVTSHSAQMNAYFTVLDYFNWTQGLVIADEDNIYNKNEFLEYSATFNYLAVESFTNIESLVNRVIKPLGTTLYYIFTNSVLSSIIQESLKSKKLLLEGDGLILNQNSGYDCKIDGAIIITVKGQEYASSQKEFLFKSTENLLQYLFNSTAEPVTAEEIRYLMKGYSQKNQFSIINIQEGKREIIGSVFDGEVKIVKNLIFPGNTHNAPKSDKKILHVSISGGATNPGTPPMTTIPLFCNGAYTAWSLINDNTLGILKNFQVRYFIYDCGTLNYDEKFARPCFTKDIDKIGLAHISSASVIATGEMKLFTSLNVTIPVVGSVALGHALSSTALYPMFTRIAISNDYILALSSLFLKVLGWNKLCVLYSDDPSNKVSYSTLIENAKKYGLEILNPESLREIPDNLNRTTIKKYSDSLKAVFSTQARLLALFFMPPELYYVLEELYDLGLRKGDLVIFVSSSLFLTLGEYDFMYTYKVKDTGVPMIIISGQNWVGKVGHFAYSKIASLYNVVPYSYACNYYDAAYYIAVALDSMINQGLDYYDPYQLNLTMRAQKFIGCTGKFSIDKDSNDRIMENFDINVNKIDAASGNVTAYKIGEFHPYSSVMLTIDIPIIYGDGSTMKPEDLRNQDNECPFSDKLVRTFTKGRILAFGICFGFALISFVSAAYIWKTWWNINIKELKERQEISLQDFIVQITIGIEFFQFVAIGPDITLISSFLAKISNSFSLNLENSLKLKNGVFWIVIDGIYGAITVWLIFCAVILLRLDEKFPSVSFLRFLAWLADYLMPILGNLCFIPFISMCLNVFVCDQSIGEDFTDSFLVQDCYYFCWKGNHLIYAIFSFIALLCYEPLAIFCRPLWQELQMNLHIYTSPLFLMVKSVVQIILIAMNKTVKRADSAIHGALFAVIMAAYIGFIFRWKPYNYPRFCWWQALSLIGVLWLSVLSTISSNVEGGYLILFLLVCIGWVLIGAVGIYVQRKKYPSLLYRRKGLDTTHLFRFAFTFGKLSKTALSKIVPSRASDEYASKDFSIVKQAY